METSYYMRLSCFPLVLLVNRTEVLVEISSVSKGGELARQTQVCSQQRKFHEKAGVESRRGGQVLTWDG